MCLLQNVVYTDGPLMEKYTEPNQQFGEVPLPHSDSGSFGTGWIVKLIQNDIFKLVVTWHGFRTSAGKLHFQVRQLNMTRNSVDSPSELKEMSPTPSDILTGPLGVGPEAMT